MRDINYENGRGSEDAFLLLLRMYKNGLGKEDQLDNLYETAKNSIEENFRTTTGDGNFVFSKEDFEQLLIKYDNYPNSYVKGLFKNLILDVAYKTIGEEGKGTLGNYVPIDENGKRGFNASSWLCHVLQVSEFAEDMASAMGLNADTAKKLAILHDIGRVKNHSFSHTVIGEQILREEGWSEEAPICLTHSYLTGDVAANNELAPPNWNINEKGEVVWENGVKPNMAKWLENYNCNDYDLVIQLADLLVEKRGTVDMKARLEGIRQRREAKGDNLNMQSNRAYFLTKLYNTIIDSMCRIDCNNKEGIMAKYPKIEFVYTDDNGNAKKRTVEEMESLLYGVSKENGQEQSLTQYFSEFYQHKIKGKAIANQKIKCK